MPVRIYSGCKVCLGLPNWLMLTTHSLLKRIHLRASSANIRE